MVNSFTVYAFEASSLTSSALRFEKKNQSAVERCDRRAEKRRTTNDRRTTGDTTGRITKERRTSSRRKVARRRQIDPTTCERDYNDEEIAFMKAMDEYKRRSGRQFPTWSEVLEVVRSLGYRQVEEPTELVVRIS